MQNLQITYLSQIKITSQVIYVITILAVVAALAALPFISVNVSIKSSGLLQSDIEKAELLAPVSGHLVVLNLKDNQKVSAGDTILAIDPAAPRKQGILLNSRTELLDQMLGDIELMTNRARQGKMPQSDLTLKTGQYQASWQQFLLQMHSAYLKKEQAEKTLSRYVRLDTSKVISDAEFEKYRLENEQAASEYDFILKQYRTQWQTEANQHRQEQRELEGRRTELNEQNKLYTLKAPVSGSLQNLTGLQQGTYVFANQKIAEISPDTGIVAVCYVSPADIGLIKEGQEVRLQIDAFNYNQWGIMEAAVVDISDDILLTQNQSPVFKVKCRLKTDHLQLRNGYKGLMKKGMTFRSRFMVAERTLWQLLYDKVDDWINPGRLRSQN